ncbi:phage tail protein I [Veronia pacifica]|uniref:Phage tail protein I n=1 Tax=Veronia pacifica TaxID=1080227 RepID=A0A1C3E9B0_9GAMM|nr:phage tail protein I [Veronia pacifica]ODA29857.1 phage tail protein I [Veronia pacifica]
MSAPTDFISIQPENRSTLEEALEYGWHRLIETAERPYPDLRQPMQTQAAFVALLASERGVLDWQPGDSLDQHRKTTEYAFEIHSKAGTRHGLKAGLQALGCEAVVMPWYQTGEASYSLAVEVSQERPFDRRMAERVQKRLDATKAERDTIDLTLAHDTQTGFMLSGAISRPLIDQEHTATGEMPDDSACRGTLSFYGATQRVLVSDFSPGAKL